MVHLNPVMLYGTNNHLDIESQQQLACTIEFLWDYSEINETNVYVDK